MHPMLTVAVKAARRAGSVINRASNNLDTLTVQTKGQNDFVSEVDRQAENAIVETLLEAYPKHAILAEEGGAHGNSEFTWIIDPLDGTTNFLHGVPHYCVSIALQHRGVITHSVVYDPIRNDLFTATRGAGAYLNDRRIRVSRRIALKDALVATGFPYNDFGHVDVYLATLKELMQMSAGVRRFGAAALDLAYVATGQYDAFWEFHLKPWDIAAGGLLVLEAGGLITDHHGNENFMETGNVLAGTPKVFNQALQLLEPLVKDIR